MREYKMHRYFSINELTEQCKKQSAWSSEVINYYWPRERPDSVLDVGCGPSPKYLYNRFSPLKVGVDIDSDVLKYLSKGIQLVTAIGTRLPFKDNSFKVVMCHYLLLWTPIRETLLELWRVTARGGRLLCASEPDYFNRVEEPEGIKNEFISALELLGADPGAGAKLESELAALTNENDHEVGILAPVEDKAFQLSELLNDVQFINSVLKTDVSGKALRLIEALKEKRGNVYMPVYYGCAYKQ